MSKQPCPKHQDELIKYIIFHQDKSRLCCNCRLIDEGKFVSDAIEIKKAIDYPEELLMHFSQNDHQYEIIKSIFKFDQNYYRDLLKQYEIQIKELTEKLFADFNNLQLQSEKLIKLLKVFRMYVNQNTNHDNFKKIIQEFESCNSQFNMNAFSKFQETVNQFLTQLSQKQEDIQGVLQDDNLLSFHTSMLYSPFLPIIEQQITSKLNKKIRSFKPIYASNKDGLQQNALWDKIDEQDNLIMFFKSGSQHVFGGYSPCKWGKNIKDGWVSDSTLASFIFSQTNCQIFPLKSEKQQYALYSLQSSHYGPAYGGGYDIYFSYNFTVGGASPSNSYENKTGQAIYLNGTSQIILECEIYQVIFD